MKMTETYEINVLCLNCGDEDETLEVDCGKVITKQALKLLECERCECKGYLIKNLDVSDKLLRNLLSNKKVRSIIIEGVDSEDKNEDRSFY